MFLKPQPGEIYSFICLLFIMGFLKEDMFVTGRKD
jgi:hypothetical protein